MSVLKAGEPIALEVPELTVDSLPVGTHQIRLVVQDDSGQTSEPFFADITVTPIIRTGPVIDTGPIRTGPVVDPGPVRTGPVITRGPVVDSDADRHAESDHSESITPSPINRIIPERSFLSLRRRSRKRRSSGSRRQRRRRTTDMGTAKDQLQKQGAPADRVYYATGTLLDARDFLDEQTYHRGRLARAMQYLHGSGTVSGLRVEYKSPIARGH